MKHSDNTIKIKTSIGRYSLNLGDKLGARAFGVVYKAVDHKNRQVAIKFLKCSKPGYGAFIQETLGSKGDTIGRDSSK